LDPNETPPAHDITTAAEALNAMLKSWNSTVMGFQLFTQKHCTLFLSKNKHEYKLGPSGDHATASFTSVAVQATANTGDLKVVLPVSSATINQYIGLVDANADLTWSDCDRICQQQCLSLYQQDRTPSRCYLLLSQGRAERR
jgi:hypothetical protein